MLRINLITGWAILLDKGEIEFRNLRENQIWISDFAIFDVLYLQDKYLLVFMKGVIYFSDDRIGKLLF